MKNRILFTLGLMLLLIPIKINASEGSLTIVCDKNNSNKINAGESINCSVSGTTDVDLTEITANLSLDDNLTFTSFTNGSTEGEAADGVVTLLSVAAGNFNLGTFVITANEGVFGVNASFGLTNVKFKTSDGEFEVDVDPAGIRISDTRNPLSSITIKTEDGTGVPIDFNEDTTTYNLEVDDNVNKVIITPTRKSDVNGNVSGGGTKELNYGGDNTVKITATSESGVEKVYTINITRKDGRSTENKLIQFSFTNYDFDFSKDKKDYSIILENNISELGLCNGNNNSTNKLCINNSDIAYSDKASISMLYNGNLIEISDIDDYKTIGSIDVGDNTLSVIITAENGAKETYNFTIQRKNKNNELPEKPSNKEINTNGGTGDFGIILVIVLLVVSLGIIIYMNKDIILKKIKRQ